MSLIINHNMMAMNAARNLGAIYSRLARSTQRLSSGLRINSAGDDAAGLAIRELMRADIKVIGQGIRNAADGISMIQTAEGALSVIDEKLTRMKELAEQAATGTYTTAQREIMDSEYQAMADEIDRIANATDFNQTKLLNGSLSTFHDNNGLKIHFGTGNSAAEDYYFVQIGDVRATTRTGLQVGGAGDEDVWTVQTTASALTTTISTADDKYLSFWYNVDGDSEVGQTSGAAMSNPSNLVGIYEANSGDSLQDIVDLINQGAASRILVNFASSAASAITNTSATQQEVVVGNTTILFHYTANSASTADDAEVKVNVSGAANIASAFTSAFNLYTSADTFAVRVDADSVMLFAKAAGTTGNTIEFKESGASADYEFVDLITGTSADSGNFSMGGTGWITAEAYDNGTTYQLKVLGTNRSEDYDVWVMDFDQITAYNYTSGWGQNLTNYESADWEETQNASGVATWEGAEIRTQSQAQDALAALDLAILRKDIIRASLGALQNRLENTMTQLGIQAENLQAAESRISDVDVAIEMTEFTRNNILAQAATAMLAQANSVSQLALTLLS